MDHLAVGTLVEEDVRIGADVRLRGNVNDQPFAQELSLTNSVGEEGVMLSDMAMRTVSGL
ncbi:hypothetical protein LZ009_09315 [Ramlibacter sp. XY19]|uniref:hypothetical protein n=1 Tax=Ramlibacter paludis TaxID=2908000 RepID=UPI0023DB2745|nr:hypothetical protein [Ramlibacter paludis]MCG2592978.1 hypothetical protein [Ramlibacter paludis]